LFIILLVASLLAFPTIAVFNTIVVGLLALTWARGPATRRLGFAVGGVLAGAWGLAVVAYYVQYVPALLNNTLPALLNPSTVAAATSNAPPPATVHWRTPLDLLGWTLGYLVSSLPLIMGLAGLGILWSAVDRRTLRPERWLGWLTAAWVSILGLFLVVNYRVDMIGKHLFYTVLPLAVGAGIFLWLLTRRDGAARLLAGLIMGALAWTALAFWAERLIQAST